MSQQTTTQEQPKAPAPGTPEYEAAMIDKADKTMTPPAGERPAWLPEGFDTPEQFAEAYAKLTAEGGEETEDEPPKAEAPKDETPKEEDAAKAAAESAGLDIAKLQEEFDTNGTLSDESYQALEAKGFTREIVDNYISGQQAKADLFEAKAYEQAGGKEQYAVITAWAGANLSPEEINEFNSQVTKGSIEATSLAIAGLRAKYEAANGTDPSLITGNGGKVSKGYASRAEMTADMKDPRYKTDPAFRASVERKIQQSPNLY